MTHAIIDADVLLYQSMPHRKAGEETFMTVVDRFNRLVVECLEKNFCGTYTLFFTTPGENFRKTLYSSYKENRNNDPSLRPPHLYELKDYMMLKEPNAFGSPSGEADDYVMEMAADMYESDDPYVICSLDKDLKTGPSAYWNTRYRERHYITEQFSYEYTLEQFLTGDSGDDAPGLYRVGHAFAQRFLAKGDDDKAKWNIVKDVWKEKTGDGWEEAFNKTSNQVFIRRSKEDLKSLDMAEMSFEDFCKVFRFHLYTDPEVNQQEISGT